MKEEEKVRLEKELIGQQRQEQLFTSAKQAEERRRTEEREQTEKTAQEERQRSEQRREEERRREEDRHREDDNRREELRRQEEQKKYPIGGKSNDIGTLAIQDAIGLVGGIAKDTVYIGRTVKAMHEEKKENVKQPQGEKPKESPAMQRYKAKSDAMKDRVESRIKAQSLNKAHGHER